jgi:hypothetical protein
MTDTQRTNHARHEPRWGRWTIGLGALAVVIGAAVIMAVQAPSASALAWADESISNGGLRQAARLREISPAGSSLDAAAIPVEIRPIEIIDPTATPVPTATPQPITTATRTAAPRSMTSRTLVKSSTPQALPKPIAPQRPLDFSFYAKAWCATRKIQNLTLMLTAHGGQPPYDYYDGDVLLAKGEKGSFRYSRDAPAGNPVPYKIIIVDSLGQRYSEDFFFKSHLSCGF